MHHTKYIMIYTLEFMAPLLLTVVRSDLLKKISFYYQKPPKKDIILLSKISFYYQKLIRYKKISFYYQKLIRLINSPA